MRFDTAPSRPIHRAAPPCPRSTRLITGLCGLMLALTAVPALAQSKEDLFRQQRLLDRQLDAQRKQFAPVQSRFDFQFGGWLDYYALNYDDGEQESRTAQRVGGAFWARARFEDAHEIFARVKLRYTYFNTGDEVERQEDLWGPNFDEAWYQVDLLRALYARAEDDRVSIKFRLGRQPIYFGTGYALDLPLDAALADLKLFDARLQLLFGKTIPSYPNIDTSEPVDTHSNRRFYGMQLEYEGWQHHIPFIYAVWQDDKTDERPQDYDQAYSYDTFYGGFGMRGEIVKNLNYYAEGVLETGKSYGDGDFVRRNDVEAWALDVGIEQKFAVPTKPRIGGEYMFASGDSDRLGSPMNASGGNSHGRIDRSFVGFGLRDTGVSLSPINSNMHIFKASAAFQPLEKIELFKDFEFGSSWFLYYKHREKGAISDPLADEFAGYVGWEMDYFLNWRLASDISWTVRWGTFFPGDAYSVDDTRHFIFSGVTWSF